MVAPHQSCVLRVRCEDCRAAFCHRQRTAVRFVCRFHVPVTFGAFISFGSQRLCIAFPSWLGYWAALDARRHLSVSLLLSLFVYLKWWSLVNLWPASVVTLVVSYLTASPNLACTIVSLNSPLMFFKVPEASDQKGWLFFVISRLIAVSRCVFALPWSFLVPLLRVF